MTVDTTALFEKCLELEVADAIKRSPSYTLDDFVVTGRASAKYGNKQNLEWWHDNGPGMVDAWQTWKQEQGWTLYEASPGVPGVEMELLFTLPGDIPIKAYLDRAYVLPTGELAVVDIKTGSRMPDTGEQLGLYATGMELLGHPRPRWGFYWDARKGTHSQPFDLDPFTVDWFTDVFATAIRQINAGGFLAKVQNGCPGWCSVAHACALAQTTT